MVLSLNFKLVKILYTSHVEHIERVNEVLNILPTMLLSNQHWWDLDSMKRFMCPKKLFYFLLYCFHYYYHTFREWKWVNKTQYQVLDYIWIQYLFSYQNFKITSHKKDRKAKAIDKIIIWTIRHLNFIIIIKWWRCGCDMANMESWKLDICICKLWCFLVNDITACI